MYRNKYGRRVSDVIAWGYDADYHCPGCAVARFGESDDSPGGLYPWIPDTAEDSEGNIVAPIFAGSEWYDYTYDEPQALTCYDCGGIIDTYGED